MNQRQAARLKRLSEVLAAENRSRFMFELLVPAEKAPLDKLKGDKKTYNVELWPRLMVEAIRELEDAGVDPDVWKVEGLGRREDCDAIVAAARGGGRDRVGCIVLGRGADHRRVRRWLEVAAQVPGFIRFCGRPHRFLGPAGRLADQEGDARAGCRRDRGALSRVCGSLRTRTRVHRAAPLIGPDRMQEKGSPVA